MDNSFIISLAQNILEGAKKANVEMRLIGGVAFWMRCPNQRNFILKDRIYKDIDFVALVKDREKINGLLISKKLLPHPYFETIPCALYSRYQILDKYSLYPICDINYNYIWYNQKIDIRDRLIIDETTVPLAELFLSKLQAVEICLQDLIDIQALLIEHDFDNIDGDKINISIINHLCSINWGLEHTVKINLEKLYDYTMNSSFIEQHDKKKINEKINFVLKELENYPKSCKWKTKSICGEHGNWYEEVDELLEHNY